jgi:hypothetical protein
VIDSLNLTIDPCIRVPEQSSLTLHAFAWPNPGKGSFALVVDGFPKGQILLMVRDMTGQIIHRSEIMANGMESMKVHFDDMKQGLYLIEVADRDQRIAFKVLVL